MKTKTFLVAQEPPTVLSAVEELFRKHHAEVSSDSHDLKSLDVLKILQPGLGELGFQSHIRPDVKSKKSIELPADDPSSALICKFDAFHKQQGVALMVHAGRGVINNDFLKSVLHASLAKDVSYLVLAVRNTYRKSNNYDTVRAFLEVLLSSQNTILDLNAVRLIGY